MNEKMPIGEFFDNFIATLIIEGYKEGTIRIKKLHCNQIAEFAEEAGETAYSTTLGTAFLEQHFNIQPKNGRIPYAIGINRTVLMLNDFFEGLPFKRMYIKPKNTSLGDKQLKLINDFVKSLTNKGYAKAPTEVFKRVAKHYFEFFIENNIDHKQLTVRDIDRLLTVFEEYRPVTIKKNIQVLKHLVRFLYENGEIADDFSEKIPYLRIYRKSDIPSVWLAEDLRRIFNVIDKNSPLGKRNMVILMLASRLGLRGSDIRNLKLSDIDWDNDTISFIQSKTKEPIILPFPADVGEAIVEYLRYGRPQSKCDEIILRHNAPFEPFESNTGFNNIIIRYAKKADVKLTSERKHGLHSLRHTFASELLEQNVTPSTIAGLLGHTSTENVSVYLKAQDDMLRECCLDIEEVVANGR